MAKVVGAGRGVERLGASRGSRVQARLSSRRSRRRDGVGAVGTDFCARRRWRVLGQNQIRTRGGVAAMHSLGGKLVGAPTVASANVETGKVSQTSVFVRGVDNIVYEKTWTQTIGPDSIKEEWGNNWTPHESHWLEDGFKLDSSPAASYSGKGNEILLAANSDSGQPFVKKRRETSKQIHSKEADYELTTREWDRNWTPLGGKILDAPFAWWSSVYAEAPDGRLFQNHQNLEDGWSGWKADNDDFLLGAPPSVSSNYMDRCNVFARGKDGQLWAKRWVD